MIKKAKEVFNNFEEFNMKNEIIKCLILLFLSIVVSIQMVKIDYLFFHSIVMFIGIIICFAIYLFAYNTYRIAKSDFFIILGIGSLVVGMIDILHTVSYFNVGLFGLEANNLAASLWLIGRYVGSITVFASSIVLYRDKKQLNIRIVKIIYLVTFMSIILSVYVFRGFPTNYIEGLGSTPFNKICRVIIVLILVATLIIFHKTLNTINKGLVFYMELSIVFNIINELLFIFFSHNHSIENTSAFVLRTIAFYMRYKAIVQIGLREPFDNISLALADVTNKLEQQDELRMKFEEALINSEECYKILIEDSSDAIFIYSNKKQVFSNETAAKMFGFSSVEEMLRTDVFDTIDKEDLNVCKALVREVINNKKNIYVKNTMFFTLHGNRIFVKVKGTRILYQGNPSVLIVMKDLTDKKKVEKLSVDIEEKGKQLEDTLNLNKLITEHFANVSHELRTPLNVILGAVQILGFYNTEKTIVSSIEKVQNYHKTIKQNCYRLLRLVNNLIDLSKIDSGFFELNRHNGNIVEIVEDITMSVVTYCESKNVNIVFDTDIEEKFMAFDHDKLERIILNLLSNAIKFTKAGDMIFVYIGDLEDRINIIVKDTGIGIEEEKLNLIFERYRQADGGLNRAQGTGIGLSLVKALIELHGGTIAVKSKVGEGTEFSIVLPAKRIEEDNNLVREMNSQTNVERISIEFSDIYS
jgi:PAS domain S-box-containing protein